VLGLRRVCVGLHSMYCPFTVYLIIRYRNSGTLRVRVQDTHSARCCQLFSTITLMSDALVSLRRSTVLRGSVVSCTRTRCSLCSKFNGQFSFHLLVCVFRSFTVRLAFVLHLFCVRLPFIKNETQTVRKLFSDAYCTLHIAM